jgi:hypothetical protein
MKSPIIDGDWIFVDHPDEITIDYVGLRFEDDTLYTIRDSGLTHEGKFAISGDTIIIEEFGNKINKQRRIKTFTSDSLILTGGVFENKYYSRNLEFTDNLHLDNMEIKAEGCFGECPEFTLRLTDSGQIYFKPKVNCKVTQETEFKIDKEKMNKVDSLFKWTYLHKLDTTQISGAVDDWSFDISITYNSGQTVKLKTTYFYIPYRLKKIFGLLITDIRERDLI